MTRGVGQGDSKIRRIIVNSTLYIILAAILLPILGNYVVLWSTKNKIYAAEEVEVRDVAIVFGAGLTRSGGPTTILKDRVETGVELYLTGKVKKLLMTGDNRFEDYNEPQAMKDYALELGVPEDDIVLDYAGRRTYDSCYRAKEIFLVKNAILVTQEFHISRALFLCDGLGLDAVGVVANNRVYTQRSINYWNVREFIARGVAIKDLIIRPKPVMGDIEPIKLEDQ